MLQGGYASISKAIRDSFFHIVSVMTTTGYATADFDLWPAFCKMLIFIVLILVRARLPQVEASR